MTSQRDTLGWLKQGARAFAFGNPLYGLTLGGRGVTGLAAVPNDPWPGDFGYGRRHHGRRLPLRAAR